MASLDGTGTLAGSLDAPFAGSLAATAGEPGTAAGERPPPPQAMLRPTWASAYGTGQLRLTVVDGDDLEIPGVTLVLEQEESGMVLERVTDGLGQFLFEDLEPGAYRLRAIKGGFKGLTIAAIRVRPSRTATLTAVLEPEHEEELGVVVSVRQRPVEPRATGIRLFSAWRGR